MGYRKQTLQERLGRTSLDELIALGIVRYDRGLCRRSDLPSDLVRDVEAFEVKASSYRMGADQTALRSEIAHRSWPVVPSVAVYRRLVLDVYGYLSEGLDRDAADTLEPPWSGSDVEALWTRHPERKHRKRPDIEEPPYLRWFGVVGATGIEPVTSAV